VGCVAFPRFAKNICPVRFRDLFRAVSCFVVSSNNYFARPAGDAVERTADAIRLVAGNHANGNGQPLIGHDKIKPEIREMNKRGFSHALKLQLAFRSLKIL
jgi:hypothetical protein